MFYLFPCRYSVYTTSIWSVYRPVWPQMFNSFFVFPSAVRDPITLLVASDPLYPLDSSLDLR